MSPRYCCLCSPLSWLTEWKADGKTGDLMYPVVTTLWNIQFYLSVMVVLFPNKNHYYHQFLMLSTLCVLSPLTISASLTFIPILWKETTEGEMLSNLPRSQSSTTGIWSEIFLTVEAVPTPDCPHLPLGMSLATADNCHSLTLVLPLGKLSHFGEVGNLWEGEF